MSDTSSNKQVTKKENAKPPQTQQQRPPPLQQQGMMPPQGMPPQGMPPHPPAAFMAPPPHGPHHHPHHHQMPPHPHPYPPGAFAYHGMPPPGSGPPNPNDPNQQRMLQIQIRQHQLQLQQLQQRQSQAAQQQQQQMQQSKPPTSSTLKATPPSTATPKVMPPTTPLQHSPVGPPAAIATNASAPNTSTKKKSTSPTPQKKVVIPPPPSQQDVNQWLSQCDWKDLTIYATRQLLGSTHVNGFLKATAAAQKIKKGRARQVKTTKRKAQESSLLLADGRDEQQSQSSEKESSSTTTPAATTTTLTNPNAPMTIQEEKRELLNARTAKRIKTELQQGAASCQHLYETIQTILHTLDPSVVLPPIYVPPVNSMQVPTPPTTTTNRALSTGRARTSVASTSKSTSSYGAASTSLSSSKATTKSSKQKSTTTAASNAMQNTSGVQGSSLRKLRKRKLATHVLDLGLSETDAHGKRLYTKKEHAARIAEVLRFRSLKTGDYVAARLSSRDLWILARVVHDYPPVNMNAEDFLKLTIPKRDAMFRNKVIVKDAEHTSSAEPIAVARQLVLPLPRTYAEAAEWGTRLRKGLRIYAMYPHTTSLYVATVIDNTTYCRGDDDIIVVEFDEDERDATGAIPKCHVPARFCAAIPKEFQGTKKKAATTTAAKQANAAPKQTKRASTTKTKAAAAASAGKSAAPDQSDPTLNNMLTDMDNALGEFNPLGDFSG